MCYSPIQIVNPSKYISLKFRDRYLLSVPCGKCAECQQTLSNQWFLRSWCECTDLLSSSSSNDAYVYFDTLTYDDAHIPYMSEVLDLFPQVSCFRPKDIRLFIEALRIDCKRKFNSSFRYFLSSEYGSERYTARPHYHILFWVKNIPPLEFSSLIANHWIHGRTDGIPWRSSAYVLGKNVISCQDALPENFLRACRYVTKYVQKSCAFSKELDNRVTHAMLLIAEKMPDDWLQSVNAQRLREKLRRRVNHFHRQSKGFGASLLANLDLTDLFESGTIIMPSPKGIKIPVALPTYYKRKLFYDLIEIDGAKTWQLNELGVQYRDYRMSKLIRCLADNFYCFSNDFNLNFSYQDCFDLADYVYNSQGRINADIESSNFIEKIASVTLFNYITRTDKEHLGHCGLINRFIGNSSSGYLEDSLPPSYSIKSFINKYVIYDERKEKQLSLIYHELTKRNERLQSCYELKQRLKEVYNAVR